MDKIKLGDIEYCLTKIDYKEELQFMEDCYFGEGGFRDGTYLEQWPRETDTGFKFRKKIATFPDVFRSEFDALIEPIYSKEITREVNSDSVKAYMSYPRKRLGEAMNGFMENLSKTGLRLGTVFCVTTAPTETAVSAEDNTNVRFLPYSQIIKPQDIEGYILNEYGGLQTLVYLERTYEDCDKNIKSEYRVWHSGIEGNLSFLVDGSGQVITSQQDNEGEIIDTTFETYKYFPAEMFEFNDRYNETKIAKPKFYNVARKFLRQYLLTSNVDDGYWKNCFAILVYHGKTDNISLGNDSVLEAPIDATSPSFIAPPTEHIGKMEETMSNDKKDAQEAMTSASAVASTASAQARMEVDRRRREILTNLSITIQAYELAIVNVMLRDYIKGSWIAEITYPTDFDSVSSFDIISLYSDLANSGMVTPEIKQKLGAKAIEILPNLSEKEKEEWVLIQEAGKLETDIIPNFGDNVSDD